jgi:hypothetical protein
MGKVTHRGWYSSSDEIPQPISILMGNNLRKDSDEELKRIGTIRAAQRLLPDPAPGSSNSAKIPADSRAHFRITILLNPGVVKAANT